MFPVWQNAISLGGVLVCFAALCALAIVFIWKFLPETKGLPVEEIVRIFEKQQEQNRRPEPTRDRCLPGGRRACGYRGGPAVSFRLRSSAGPTG